MRRYRISSTLRPVLAAILAVALMTGGVLAAAPGPRRARRSGLPARRVICLYHPTFLHNQYNYQSALYVQNPGAVPATVQLTFSRATAGPITLSATVQPGAMLRLRARPGSGTTGRVVLAGDRLRPAPGQRGRDLPDDRRPAGRLPRDDSPGRRICGRPIWAPLSVSVQPLLRQRRADPLEHRRAGAQAEIDLYQPDGSLVKSVTVTIAANATYAVSGPGIQIPPGRYTAVVSADDPIGRTTDCPDRQASRPRCSNCRRQRPRQVSRPACRVPRSRWMKEAARARASSSSPTSAAQAATSL